MKRVFTFFILFFIFDSVYSQELIVKSFILGVNDLSAQTQPRKDLNDKNCALVKVGIGLQGVQFEGNIVGNVVNKTGEYWVYMPQGSRMLKVKHPNYSPIMVSFSNYGVERVESNRTYILTLNASNGVKAVQQQLLAIKYSPSSAMVLVDSKLVKGMNGIVKTILPVGQHSYMVVCDGYESEEGTVKLKATAPSNLQIILSKNQNDTNSQASTDVFLSNGIEKFSGNKISIPVKNGISIEMVKVEAGTFTMGATPEMKKPWKDESPTHRVTLSQDYYIGTFEVSQSLWAVVMENNPSHFKGENLPVENVSWFDCQEFISKLNSITGRKFRLPTEAEWEFAARGGNRNVGYQFSGSNVLNVVAWYGDGNSWQTHPVGTKQPNELGIYDMAGNVYEWCQDWKGDYVAIQQFDPSGPFEGAARVVRGGSWDMDERSCRISCRGNFAPGYRGDHLGFRLVLTE